MRVMLACLLLLFAGCVESGTSVSFVDPDGNTITGVEVRAYGEGGLIATLNAADGTLSADDLPGSASEVRVSAAGYETRTLSLPLPAVVVLEPSAANVARFPQVKLGESATAGTIYMEHRAGDCIALADYTWRVDSSTQSPTSNADGSGSPSQFCVGETIYLQGTDGQVNVVKVVDDRANAVVFERSIAM